jgi:hypothetical protein
MSPTPIAVEALLDIHERLLAHVAGCPMSRRVCSYDPLKASGRILT